MDVYRAARFLENKLKVLGFQTEIWETPGQPSLFAERIENPKLPTLLVYGHLDVQPVDPLDKWKKPPFEPWVQGNKLFGRGSADDKGQVMIHVKACEGLIKKEGRLPVNVKFIIEGEEEVGSPNFEFLLKKHRNRLESAATLISDTAMVAEGRPSISCATRGLICFEIEASGPTTDLHSGSFGGVVRNPLTVLSQILANMMDKKGKVTIPGFYRDVVGLTKQERLLFKKVKFLEKELGRVSGVPSLGGEKGYSVLERVWARPTFEIHGLSGGFQGEGSKTIIPTCALAKVSMRLVPKQNPSQIASLFISHVKKLVPKGVKVAVRQIPGGGPAWMEDIGHPAFRAASESLKQAFGREPVFIRCGGSIFAPEILKRYFPKTPVILIGFGLPNENSHAPNEWLSLENYRRGIAACHYFFLAVAARSIVNFAN